MPSKTYTIAPRHIDEDFDHNAASHAEPTSGELSDSDWVEMEDKEWTDEQLIDDARPGRRTGKVEWLLTLLELVSSRCEGK